MLLSAASTAQAWNDNTHLAISRAAGYEKWYNSAAADAAKIKAGLVEEQNHYSNIPLNVLINRTIVLQQVTKYNSNTDTGGHLYGAILGALLTYIDDTGMKKYADYSLAYMAHYIGDLSQPLHNMEYNKFNKNMHLQCDEIVDSEVQGNIAEIQKNMYLVTIRKQLFQEDIADAISHVANESRILAKQLEIEKRPLTKREAYKQLGHSASLLKGILQYL